MDDVEVDMLTELESEADEIEGGDFVQLSPLKEDPRLLFEVSWSWSASCLSHLAVAVLPPVLEPSILWRVEWWSPPLPLCEGPPPVLEVSLWFR